MNEVRPRLVQYPPLCAIRVRHLSAPSSVSWELNSLPWGIMYIKLREAHRMSCLYSFIATSALFVTLDVLNTYYTYYASTSPIT